MAANRVPAAQTELNSTPTSSDPSVLFSRSLGWLSESDLKLIQLTRVGICGVGGVGGSYAEALARLGVEHFVLYDPDVFEPENTNRQNECRQSNYGRPKVEVIKDLILDINPKAQVEVFQAELKHQNIEGFVRGIDFYFDGLDFFCFDIRTALFQALRTRGIPAITVAPVGSGGASLFFDRDSMSFDDYFGLHQAADHEEKAIFFSSGLTPSLMQRQYLQDRSKFRFRDKKVSSLPTGVSAATSLAVSQFIAWRLNRGRLYRAPWNLHFDPILMKFKRSYVLWGFKNPMQKLKRWLMKRILR